MQDLSLWSPLLPPLWWEPIFFAWRGYGAFTSPRCLPAYTTQPWGGPQNVALRRRFFCFADRRSLSTAIIWSSRTISVPHRWPRTASPGDLLVTPPIAQTLISPALWPAFSEAFARNDLAWVRRTFLRTLWITMGPPWLYARLSPCRTVDHPYLGRPIRRSNPAAHGPDLPLGADCHFYEQHRHNPRRQRRYAPDGLDRSGIFALQSRPIDLLGAADRSAGLRPRHHRVLSRHPGGAQTWKGYQVLRGGMKFKSILRAPRFFRFVQAFSLGKCG